MPHVAPIEIKTSTPKPARAPRAPRAVTPRTPQVAASEVSDGPPEREPCTCCGTTSGGLTPSGKYERSKGRCQSCYNFFRRHGVDKPVSQSSAA
jgi:hypothetical protein